MVTGLAALFEAPAVPATGFLTCAGEVLDTVAGEHRGGQEAVVVGGPGQANHAVLQPAALTREAVRHRRPDASHNDPLRRQVRQGGGRRQPRGLADLAGILLARQHPPAGKRLAARRSH
jgi:hypothetical protein